MQTPLVSCFLAGWVPEIGGSASNIMNIALEILILYHTLCLCKNGSMTARLHNASLMESQGTEITAAKTAAVTDQAELDLEIAGIPPSFS